MEHAWHGRCARCEQIIRRELVDDHGVVYHCGCFDRRADVLSPSPVAVADWVVDELGPDRD